MPHVHLADTRIHYERHGSGPPLLLVPGLNGQAAFWSRQLPALTPHFEVIVHDHRGCGASTPSLIEYSINQMADDVLGLMNALDISSATLVGHSTGGAIGQTLALDHPDRIQRLVLSATWAGPDPWFQRSFELRLQILRELGLEWYARAGTLATLPPRWIATHEDQIGARADRAAPPPAITEAQAIRIIDSRIRAILAYDRRACLARIRQPTLVVCARDDLVTPPHLSEELASSIPRARLVLLEAGGHFVPHTDPQGYNQTLLEFLLESADAE
ncbi:MAG: alpha/beta fold hydrolase [Gammaproteobacteria bacterium]|nr:alpha/beta fold hydrolase [Gammaproteobacteria bacterium]